MRWVCLTALSCVACSSGVTPPVVDAGEDRTVFPDDAVELSGSATGELLSIQWNQISGTEVALENATSVTARFVAPAVAAPEMLVFALSASSKEGATATDFVVVTVELRNRPPLVSAGPAQTVMSADRVVLAGSADDEDGTIASLLWRQTGGPGVPLSGVNLETPTFVAPETAEAVTLSFELTATDDGGASATAATRVNVVPRSTSGNIAPEVDAGPDLTTDELAPVTLEGMVSDADGRIVSIAWTQLSGPPATLSSTGTPIVELLAPGVAAETELLFELSAIDDRGARVADRATVTVTPLVAPNQAPVADAGADQKVAELAPVALAGAGVDADGQIASYAWRQLAGPSVVLAGETTAAPTFTAPSAECEVRLAFELTVTDNEGATGTDSTVVIVNPPSGP